jgi:hypothetical protein
MVEMHGSTFPPGGALCGKDDVPSTIESYIEGGLTVYVRPSNISNTCESKA